MPRIGKDINFFSSPVTSLTYRDSTGTCVSAGQYFHVLPKCSVTFVVRSWDMILKVDMMVIIDRKAREIMHLVASVCLSVHLSVLSRLNRLTSACRVQQKNLHIHVQVLAESINIFEM